MVRFYCNYLTIRYKREDRIKVCTSFVCGNYGLWWCFSSGLFGVNLLQEDLHTSIFVLQLKLQINVPWPWCQFLLIILNAIKKLLKFPYKFIRVFGLKSLILLHVDEITGFGNKNVLLSPFYLLLGNWYLVTYSDT